MQDGAEGAQEVCAEEPQRARGQWDTKGRGRAGGWGAGRTGLGDEVVWISR